MGDMIEPSHINREIRLEIYQNAYLLRLAEALQSNYPSLYAVLGENDFGNMMLGYLNSGNPTTASIRWFGSGLSDFLKSHRPYEEVPLLSDIARFEWALRHTVDAADARPCSFEELSRLDTEGWMHLYIGLHPSVSLVTQEWNAAAVVRAVAQEQSVPDPQPDPSYWLIYRDPQGAGSWRSVSHQEWTALCSIMTPTSFSNFCEMIATCEGDTGEAAHYASTYMRLWVEEGIIVSPE